MASGGDEHRMVFDLRGRRRGVVKVIYAILAVLMAASLLLVVGPFSIGEIFNSNTANNSEIAESFEQQAERLERKLAKEPGNPDYLLGLTRARINAGNARAERNEATGEIAITVEGRQQLQKAAAAWAEYLDATDKPNAGAAQLASNTLFTLAQTSRTTTEATNNIEAAAQAQLIVAKQRPSIGSLTTAAFYTLYAFDWKQAEQLRDQALAEANTKAERRSIERQYDEIEKRAREFQKQVKEAEKVTRGQGKEALQNPLGGLGGATLTE